MGSRSWSAVVVCTLVLAAVFVIWYRTEHTLSIHSIDNPRREAFYWLTVISTFALGTAAGDMTATTFHLGYFVSGVVFTVLIAIPAGAIADMHDQHRRINQLGQADGSHLQR